MRLFLDTNVVLSAILFPEGRAAAFFRRAITDHTILLSDYVVDELRTVFTRKFPTKVDVLERFLAELSFEAIDAPIDRSTSAHRGLRDPKDAPIVDDAIRSGCDYLVTGDKDLHVLEREGLPKIIAPGDFLVMDEASNDESG